MHSAGCSVPHGPTGAVQLCPGGLWSALWASRAADGPMCEGGVGHFHRRLRASVPSFFLSLTCQFFHAPGTVSYVFSPEPPPSRCTDLSPSVPCSPSVSSDVASLLTRPHAQCPRPPVPQRGRGSFWGEGGWHSPAQSRLEYICRPCPVPPSSHQRPEAGTLAFSPYCLLPGHRMSSVQLNFAER